MKNESIFSDKIVDTLKQYFNYVGSQGGDSFNETDKIGGLMIAALNVSEAAFKLFDAVMSKQMLVSVTGAENIIDRGLRDGMSKKKYYKDIYQDVKKRVITFAELHGQSEVITKQLESN